jgi:ketosteroid isomerase-like protein
MSIGEEIRQIVRAINRAWLENRPDELSRFFHPQIVMVPPGMESRIAGSEACVAGFVQFLAAAKVIDFRESDIHVESWGDTALATLRFDITYRMGGRELTEAGRDIWLFHCEQMGWRALWRTQVPVPTNPAA